MADVDVDLGAGPHRLPADTVVLDLRPLVPAEGAVDWSALDALPRLLTVDWGGADRGIGAAVAARPGIQFLYWYDAIGEVDLTASGLNTVKFEGPGLTSARLPGNLENAQFVRTSPRLRVEAPGFTGRLGLFQYGPDVVVPEGLRSAPELWLWVAGTVSATVLDGMTDLHHLTVTFDAPPGTLEDQAALARLPLRWLQLDDAYGWSHEELPDLPTLADLILNGCRRTTATAVKARFKGSAVDVEVNGAKSEDWLAKHIDNPFRDWVDDGKAFGEAACKAYNKALSKISVDPEGALRGLVADLSAINDKWDLIDTLNREEAGQAFGDLARRAGVPPDLADAWFDDGRRF